MNIYIFFRNEPFGSTYAFEVAYNNDDDAISGANLARDISRVQDLDGNLIYTATLH